MRALLYIALGCALSGALGGDPVPSDADWLKRYQQGHLLFSPSKPDLWPLVGNGFLATKPVTDESLFVSGVFDGAAVFANCTSGPNCPEAHRAAIPTYRVDAQMDSGATDRGFAMDLERGVFLRRWSTAGSPSVQVEERWFAHRTRRGLLVHQIELAAGKSAGAGSIKVPLTVVDTMKSDELKLSLSSDTDSTRLITGINIDPEVPSLGQTLIARASNKPQRDARGGFVAEVPRSGGSVVLSFFNSLSTSIEKPDDTIDSIKARALAGLEGALKVDPAALLAEHEAAWARMWNGGRIEVSGDLNLAQAINASMYFIMSSVRSDWPQGLSPGGLGSDAYNGHSFWDCETWMYPPLLMLQPDLAKSVIQYRVDRQPGASAKAKRNGRKGLQYPWESAYSGEEVQGQSYGKIGPWGEYEQHITGDIGYAAWQYWSVTGEADYLRSDLEPMMRGIAEFITSRVSKNGTSYHVNHIMPPDEYHKNVDDSLTTNNVFRLALLGAVEAARETGREVDPAWTDIAENMFFGINETFNYHPEFEGYTGDVVKQGDVILNGWPFLFSQPASTRANDLVYYANRTDKTGPAMTWAMFSTGWLDAGDQAQADAYFLRGYANQKKPFQVWTETPTGGAINFITGAGGFLQSLVFGYGGIRIERGRLTLTPQVPPGDVKSVTIRGFFYQGNRLEVTNNASGGQVRSMGGGKPLVLVDSQGSKTRLLDDPIKLDLRQQYIIEVQ